MRLCPDCASKDALIAELKAELKLADNGTLEIVQINAALRAENSRLKEANQEQKEAMKGE